MKTKSQELQEYINLRTRPVNYLFEIYYKPFGGGWWMIPSEPRWFGDRGEYLGQTVSSAKRTIDLIL